MNLKPAFQSDASFLADVRDSLEERRFKLWWLGQSGFLVVNGGRALVLDPYLSDSLTRKYAGTDKPHDRICERVVEPQSLAALGVFELITSSHSHTDHLDAETLLPLLDRNPRAKLVIPAANREFVLERLGRNLHDRLVGLDAGTSTVIDGVDVHGIPSAHNTVERDSNGRCRFLGYVVCWAGRVLYHSGDTLRHDGLVPALRLWSIDVALLPVNGDRPERRVAGNLDGVQAAQLANEICALCVVPCHYDMFAFNTASPDEFVAECKRLGQPFRVLRLGEGLEL